MLTIGDNTYTNKYGYIFVNNTFSEVKFTMTIMDGNTVVNIIDFLYGDSPLYHDRYCVGNLGCSVQSITIIYANRNTTMVPEMRNERDLSDGLFLDIIDHNQNKKYDKMIEVIFQNKN